MLIFCHKKHLCHKYYCLFYSDAEFDDLMVKLCGEIGPTCVDFPLPQSDICKLGVTCPVKQGSQYSFKFTVEVKKFYLPVSVFCTVLYWCVMW